MYTHGDLDPITENAYCYQEGAREKVFIVFGFIVAGNPVMCVTSHGWLGTDSNDFTRL